MKKFFKYLSHDKITYWGFLTSFVFLLISYVLITFFYSNLPPFLPLYNKMPWGYERIGSKIEVFIYLGLATLFFIVNLIMSSVVYKRVALLARFLCITTVAVWFFVLIFTIQIILLMK